MDLILWRHAEAAESGHGVPGEDLERKLTIKGERQAARMAEWLNRHLAASTRVLVSPATRCQKTAAALGRDFRTVAALAPGARPGDVLLAARWPDGAEPVLIVGHQPTLGMAAALAVCGEPAPWSIRKAAVWWLRRRAGDSDHADGAQIWAVQSPDGL